MNLLNSKKAQGINYIAAVIVIFVFGFISIIATLIHANFISAFTSAGFYTGAIAVAGAKFQNALLLHDWVILFVAIAMIIGIALTSFKLNTAPAFFIITLIEGFLIGLVGFFFSFIFKEMVSNALFNSVIAVFPRTMVLCTNLHWIALLLIVVGSITLYGKKQGTEVTPIN